MAASRCALHVHDVHVHDSDVVALQLLYVDLLLTTWSIMGCLPTCCRYELQIDFLEAVFGCSKELDIDHLVECTTCEGSGVKAGTSPAPCVQCAGQGQLIQNVRTPLGTFQQVSTCPRCEGRGQMQTACEKCGGDGRTRSMKKISLTVPAGGSHAVRSRPVHATVRHAHEMMMACTANDGKCQVVVGCMCMCNLLGDSLPALSSVQEHC